MNASVTVVDYGAGNLLSVSRALEHCGAEVTLASTPRLINEAERLVLPGVGAFGVGMVELRERKLVEPIRRYAASGRPLLGICLGMQLLLEGSEEFGASDGLGLIPGHVRKLPNQPAAKLPHIGWNGVRPRVSHSWNRTPLEGVEPGEEFYFVHSFYVEPKNSDDKLAVTMYADFPFCAVIQKDNVLGCQFHLEKSSVAGLAVLRNFLKQSVWIMRASAACPE